MYKIYMHKNKINNKVYIGITSQNVKERWGKNGIKYKRHPLFWNAIQKYGWGNFEHIILTEVGSQEEAEKLEKRLIKKYHATDKKYGYNVRDFGISKTPYVVYQYDQFSGELINVWKNCYEAGKKLDIAASTIRSVCSKKHKSSHGFYFTYKNYGEKLPKDVILNIQNNSYACVAQYDLFGNFIEVYRSIEDASKKLGIGRPIVDKWISYGYIWKTVNPFVSDDYKNKINIKEISERLKNYTGRISCNQYTKTGKFIRTFNNAKEASYEVKGNYLVILRACEKLLNSAYGYIWRFCDESNNQTDLPIDDRSVVECAKNNTTIFQYSKDGTFLNSYENSTKAQNETGISRSTIKMNAYKKYANSKNFLWRFEKDNYIYGKNLPKSELTTGKQNKPVSQFTLNNEYLNTYISAADAARNINGRRECIRDCCNGKQKTAYNYLWRFATNDEIQNL